VFEDLGTLRGTGSLFDALRPVTQAEAVGLPDADFTAPADYRAFLAEIGWGALTNESLMLYSGLVPPVDIYGERPDLPSGMMLFGDDLQGYNLGFCAGDDRVFEVDPTTMDMDVVANSFSEFIRAKASAGG